MGPEWLAEPLDKQGITCHTATQIVNITFTWKIRLIQTGELKKDTNMALPTRDEAVQLFKLRRKKYRLTFAEKNILQDIYNDENLDASYGVTPLEDRDFNYDIVTGYKQLAEKFSAQIKALQQYNDNFKIKHPVINFFLGFILRKNTHNLETALTVINYHTYNLISSNKVNTVYDYSSDESAKHQHKVHTFPDNNQYEFSAVNVIRTLKEKSKRFLFFSVGLISRLKDTFTQKIEDIKEREKKSDFQIKLYDKTNKKFSTARTLQEINNNQVSILPRYTINESDATISPRQAASHIRHDTLISILAKASEAERNQDAYERINDCLKSLIRKEKDSSKTYKTLFARRNFVDFAQSIIQELETIIQLAKPESNLHKDNKPNKPSSLPIVKQKQKPALVPATTPNLYDKIIKEAKRDIYAIKAFTSYNKLSPPFEEQPEDKIVRRKDLTDSIISPVQLSSVMR